MSSRSNVDIAKYAKNKFDKLNERCSQQTYEANAHLILKTYWTILKLAKHQNVFFIIKRLLY